MHAFVFPPTATSELLSQAIRSGKLTRADHSGLMAAVLSEGLDEEEKNAIDRLLYAVRVGKIQLSDELSVLA